MIVGNFLQISKIDPIANTNIGNFFQHFSITIVGLRLYKLRYSKKNTHNISYVGILYESYVILGREAAPGGQLFNIALLCLTAHFVGWAFRIVTLPALLGMLITGIVFQNVGLISISGEYTKMTSLLR